MLHAGDAEAYEAILLMAGFTDVLYSATRTSCLVSLLLNGRTQGHTHQVLFVWECHAATFPGCTNLAVVPYFTWISSTLCRQGLAQQLGQALSFRVSRPPLLHAVPGAGGPAA